MAESESRVYRGRTLKVVTINCMDVQLDLGLGVNVQKRVVIEGVGKHALSRIPHHLRQAAMHCMIVLLGGKNLLVQVANVSTTDGCIICRVFIDAPIYVDNPALVIPKGFETPRLEVGKFYNWLSEGRFKVGRVKDVLNTRPHRKAEVADVTTS